MANPNPSHNPTDGLSTAVAVQVSGTGVTALHTPGAPGTASINAGPYSVTLSVSAAGGNASSVVLTPVLVDAKNNSYSATSASWVYRSYNDPQITESTFSSLSPSVSYTAKVASVGASGASTVTVTALAVGQAIIEVEYPTFDNTEGSITVGNLGGASAGTTVPKDAIYTQVIVTVVK
jgi:hypothetical protein